ncbi:YceI family protein [Streptomyces sp. NPDC002680]|uniref:YceI family protein n=1 Tax=Streptomyces sp. NPDC002680 TaxID=3364659 RepID=UPI0036A9086A
MSDDNSTDTTATSVTSSLAGLPLSPGDWELDPLHSAANFTIRHLGITKVRGRFTDLKAALYVGETAADVRVSAEIALASIDTGNPDRDAHTRSAELLDVAKRPTMTFRSTRVSGADENWTMEGDLTIGEVSRPITFAVELGGVAVFPLDRRNHAGFEATGEIRRGDYGLDFGTGLLSDVVKIHLDMQFVGPEGQGG